MNHALTGRHAEGKHRARPQTQNHEEEAAIVKGRREEGREGGREGGENRGRTYTTTPPEERKKRREY